MNKKKPKAKSYRVRSETINGIIADSIETYLLNHTSNTPSPIILHRYDAGTGSIYIKLDWGASRSIRIADHLGYDNLSYRFNIGSNVNHIHKTTDNYYDRWWFPATEIESLCEEILAQRDRMIEKYGIAGYKKRIKTARESSVQSRFYTHPETHEVTMRNNTKTRTAIKK